MRLIQEIWPIGKINKNKIKYLLQQGDADVTTEVVEVFVHVELKIMAVQMISMIHHNLADHKRPSET